MKLRLPPHTQDRAASRAAGFAQAYKHNRVIGLDIETDGLDAKNIWCICTAYINSTEQPHLETNLALARQHIAYLVEQGYWFVIHNAKFDVVALAKHGVNLPRERVVDSMLLSYILEPSRVGGHSLGNLGPKMDYRQALIDAGLLPPRSKKGAEYKVPYSPVMAQYCAQDVRTTRDVWNKLYPQLQEDEAALQLYWGVELPFLWCIVGMEHHGMQLDVDLAESSLRDWIDERERLAEDAQMMVGYVPGETKTYTRQCEFSPTQTVGYHTRNGARTYDHCTLQLFNPGSNPQIAWALQREGWEPKEFTPTGAPKVDAAVVGSLSDTYPLADLLTRISKLDKYIGMVGGYLEEMDPYTHRVHGSFNQCLTVTGRLSSSQPNLQNVPGRGGEGKLIRSMFKAPTGYKVVGCDLSNIEARFLAHMLSYFEGDSGLADTFAAGVDFHQVNADTWGVERGVAKTMMYGQLYGIGPAKLGGGDREKGQALLDKLDKSQPSIGALKERVWRACRRGGGLIHTWFGRRLYYPHIDSRDRTKRGRAERQVFNAVLQGGSADILKLITLEIEAHVTPHYEGWLVAQIHDELQWYIREDQAEQFRLDIEPYFAAPYLSHCPISGDAKVGDNWNQVH